MNRRRFLTLAGLGAAAATLPRIALAEGAGAPSAATAIAEVFGDGQRLVGVALEYPVPVEGRTLALPGYVVEGRRSARADVASPPPLRLRNFRSTSASALADD